MSKIHNEDFAGRVVKLPCRNSAGREIAARFVDPRTGRAAWRKAAPGVMGAEHIKAARDAGEAIFVVRDEHEMIAALTARFHAVFVPEERTQQIPALFEPDDRVVLVMTEAEAIDSSLDQWESCRARAVSVVSVPQMKMPWRPGIRPRDLVLWLDLLAEGATPISVLRERRSASERQALRPQCEAIIQSRDVLSLMCDDAEAAGVAGETSALRMLFLVLTSRLLPTPLSGAVRGPSSAGKSYIVKHSLARMPSEAFVSLSGMSEKALIYDKQSLRHKHLVLAEAAGLSDGFMNYAIRTLLSEHRLSYMYTRQAADGTYVTETIEREGPTGLLVTSTHVAMFHENETRMIPIQISDTRDQTMAIMRQHARAVAGVANVRRDTTAPWIAFQRWLARGPKDVVIPYADALAALISPVATRMRRDFPKLTTLIQTHALIHQEHRQRDQRRAVIAEIEDYRAVRDVFADTLAEAVEASIPPTVRETVNAVDALARRRDRPTVTTNELARHLQLDASTVSRRARQAVRLGFLDRHGERETSRPTYSVSERMRQDLQVLPTVEELESHLASLRA